MLRRNRSRHGGGIVVYINKSLQLYDFKIDVNFELINLTVVLNGNIKIAVLACYRSEQFVELDYFKNIENEVGFIRDKLRDSLENEEKTRKEK